MVDKNVNIEQLINARNVLVEEEKKLFLESLEHMNISMREVLKNDLGTTLVKNIARDIAGEVCRRFFDTGDYYITVDQMYERIVHFSYDNDNDIFSTDAAIRKECYNFTDSVNSETMKNIVRQCEESQKQLFTTERNKDYAVSKGIKEYRDMKTTESGDIYDELTGKAGTSKTIIRNGKEVEVSNIHIDHIQARETIKYNERYIREDRKDSLEAFYNSEYNFQAIHASANTSKGDVRVCTDEKGNVKYLNAKEMKSLQEAGEQLKDITYKATPEQLADATISQWEKETESGNKKDTLMKEGYLDENGKVKPEVRNELIAKIKNSQNKESIEILKDTDYGQVARDAAKEMASSLKKILAGQVIYYVLPPMVFETQTIIKRKDISLSNFYEEITKAGKRVKNYVVSKLKDIFKNVANNSLKKFIKCFFDIIIELVKATVKKIVKIIKDLVLSLVSCVKVLMDKNATAAQKADSITKILASTVTTIVMELLFEYLEKQFAIPGWLVEPLQIITTILATNIVMLILNELDLFDVKYGMMVSNIEKIIDEENKKYMSSSEELISLKTEELNKALEIIGLQMEETVMNIKAMNIYETDALPLLKEINDMFNMNIDFNKEWNEYINVM